MIDVPPHAPLWWSALGDATAARPPGGAHCCKHGMRQSSALQAGAFLDDCYLRLPMYYDLEQFDLRVLLRSMRGFAATRAAMVARQVLPWWWWRIRRCMLPSKEYHAL